MNDGENHEKTMQHGDGDGKLRYDEQELRQKLRIFLRDYENDVKYEKMMTCDGSMIRFVANNECTTKMMKLMKTLEDNKKWGSGHKY